MKDSSKIINFNVSNIPTTNSNVDSNTTKAETTISLMILKQLLNNMHKQLFEAFSDNPYPRFHSNELIHYSDTLE